MRSGFGALLLILGLPVTAWASAEVNPVVTHPQAQEYSQVIVKLRSAPSDSRVRIQAATDVVSALGLRLGLRLQALREVGPQMRLLKLDDGATAGSADDQLRRLRADSEIEFAEPDYRRYHHAVPDDPLYAEQWYFQAPPSPPVAPSGGSTTEINSAIDSEHAWDIATGAASTVVAVLDTGVRFDHPDLLPVAQGGRLLSGFDFVSGESTTSFLVANDGDGWDPDPSDPGDWITQDENATALFAGCGSTTELIPSSWHGTRVSGLLGAITNNAVGIAGGTWQPQILPVRVLGKCFGRDSDILNGMRWAAGLPVAGVSDNPNPAKIINLSLGASGSCPSSYPPVLSELTAMGVLVVVSAGNESGPVDSPANCAGVLAVAGLRHAGTKVGYSSFGTEVGVSAPAGNCPNISVGAPCQFHLITTINLGQTTPAGSGYATQLDAHPNIGTSFSAPLVSGIAALMQGVNSHLNSSQLIARIKEGAVAFPADPALPTCPATDVTTGQCNCTITACGAGIANALNSVNAALRPIANVARPPATSTPGQDVTLDGSASVAADNRGPLTYAWTAVTAGASPPSAGANTPVATVVAPPSGVATYRLIVTDDMGLQDHADAAVTVPSSGGGGALDPVVLLLTSAAGWFIRRRRRTRIIATARTP